MASLKIFCTQKIMPYYSELKDSITLPCRRVFIALLFIDFLPILFNYSVNDVTILINHFYSFLQQDISRYSGSNLIYCARYKFISHRLPILNYSATNSQIFFILSIYADHEYKFVTPKTQTSLLDSINVGRGGQRNHKTQKHKVKSNDAKTDDPIKMSLFEIW